MVELLDCTLRDGSNVVGAGFSKEMTVTIIESLLRGGIKVIEMGHCSGLGGNEGSAKKAPLSDEEYLEVASPYFGKAEIGMFCQPKFATENKVQSAARKGLGFLRVGINAGDSAGAADLIGMIRRYGIKVRTSLMKAYGLPAAGLTREARALEAAGANAVTIMDSAGHMVPEEVEEYVAVLKDAVSIPVGFHGHNNLGLAVANGLAAWRAGAASIDCGVMGMARSVGNIPTEAMVALLQRFGEASRYDLHSLLSSIDNEIMPPLRGKFTPPIPPVELVLGIAGCHSSFLPTFREVAREKNVDLYQLIVDVSERDKKAPSRKFIESVADAIKK